MPCLIWARGFCFGLLAGGCPAATHFSLLRQRKVSKRKATRLSGSLRCAAGDLCCPKKTGVRANSLHCVALKQRAALIPFFSVITGPDKTGPAGIKIQTTTAPRPDHGLSQVARSAAKGLRQPGRLFFAYFSLAKQKKVSSRRATPGLPMSKTFGSILGTTLC